MIILHCPDPHGGDKLACLKLGPDDAIPADALWIDLLEPTREEDNRVEAHLGISVPTREDMDDIEPSELLWNENGAHYLTARLLVRFDLGDPQLSGVTFILKDNALVTVRYSEPKSFAMFTNRLAKPGGAAPTSAAILTGLFETIIDRAADVLQEAGGSLDRLSRGVFERQSQPGARTAQLESVLHSLGRHGDLISKGRESLVSIERVLLFLTGIFDSEGAPAELRESLKAALRDVQSLEEHASFQSNKIQFLLDATLGLVNLEQNNIIKLFSVMAVIFMPPTLVASIYGMNFEHMPELKWQYGYPMALALMMVVAIAPYFLFRWKKWL